MSTTDFIPFASELAHEAGAILMSHYRKVQVEYKGSFDTVTAADRASEQWVIEQIRSHYPSHSIVAEEGGGIDQGSEFVWYIDPLDGTTNYAHGLPRFCVSIGLWAAGKGLVGVIYDPLNNDLYTAEKGSGAYLNSRRIQVSQENQLAKGLFATGFPSSIRNENPNFHYFHQVGMLSHGVRRTGSAALDLCSVACGNLEGFWEIGLKPWDVGAGLIILHEAGGTSCDFARGRYNPGDRALVATNGHVAEELLALFDEISSGNCRIPLVPLQQGGVG